MVENICPQCNGANFQSMDAPELIEEKWMQWLLCEDCSHEFQCVISDDENDPEICWNE